LSLAFNNDPEESHLESSSLSLVAASQAIGGLSAFVTGNNATINPIDNALAKHLEARTPIEKLNPQFHL